MNVSVGREFEDYVQKKVASGEYASASEVVREGLRLMKEKDRILEARLSAMRHEIQKGIDEAEASETGDGPAAMRRIRGRLEKL